MDCLSLSGGGKQQSRIPRLLSPPAFDSGQLTVSKHTASWSEVNRHPYLRGGTENEAAETTEVKHSFGITFVLHPDEGLGFARPENRVWNLGSAIRATIKQKKRCRSILFKIVLPQLYELLFAGRLKPAFSFVESDLRGPLAQRGDPFSQPSGSSAV
jgi:hypothetical protein